MSSKEFDIPRYGNAGTSFFGAEFKDAWVFLVSLLVGIVAGHFNAFLYIGVPFGGYLVNREYLQWLANGPPGRLRTWLYELGLKGYSRGHRARSVVVVGDARAINTGASDMLDEIQARLVQAQAGSASAARRPEIELDVDAILAGLESSPDTHGLTARALGSRPMQEGARHGA